MSYRICFAAALVAMASLVGCASKPTAASIAKDEAAAAAVRAQNEQRRLAAETEAAERFLSKVPDWVTTPPRNDGVNVFAVGEGQSKRLDMAQKKAVLVAELGLAKQYRQALSGSERLYQRDGTGAAVQERYTLLIDKLVDRVQLVGHEAIKQATVVIDGEFHHWVLMKLSFDEMERIVARQKQESQGRDIDAQFADLDRRLKAYREEQRQAAKPQPAAPSTPPADSANGAPPAVEAAPGPTAPNDNPGTKT